MEMTLFGIGWETWVLIALATKAIGDVVVKATPTDKDDLVWDVICVGVSDAVKKVVERLKSK